MKRWRVLAGDCIERMRDLDAESVDAIVCDPPYSLGFMGREWDKHDTPKGFQRWCREWTTEALRVLKPGGHLLAFGGTRTYHRLTCALEDAGFEIRDCVMWMYGQGFPKSLDVSKAIDKAVGAKRKVVGRRGGRASTPIRDLRNNGFHGASGRPNTIDTSAVTAPATHDAAKWNGWGTALKPSYEPIAVARKPLIGTVVKNVLKHGTGALNIDATRIASGARPHIQRRNDKALDGAVYGSGINGSRSLGTFDEGRWPANVVLDRRAGAALDVQSGVRPGCKTPSKAKSRSNFRPGQGAYQSQGPIYPDTGGASRFFYCAKVSKKERSEGLDEAHAHPTTKPVDLMRYLVRLVTPTGGVVLDPFMGSGTTGVATLREGARFVGIEREREYREVAVQRIRHAADKTIRLGRAK